MNEAQQLLAQVAAQIWSLLKTLRNELNGAAALNALAPMPGLDGTPLAGKLLEPIEALALANPTAASVLALLRALIAPPAAAAGPAIRLHGWNEKDGQPRSIALCVTVPDQANDRLVAALATDDAGEVGVHVIATVSAALPTLTPVAGSNLTVSIKPTAAGTFDVWFGPAGPREIAPAAACTIDCNVTRSGGGPLVIGADQGPRIVAQRLALTSRIVFGTPAPPLLQVGIDLGDVSIDVMPEWLSSLTGGAVRPGLQTLAIKSDAVNGLRFDSGGVRIVVPATVNLAGVNINGVAIDLETDGDGSGLRLGFGLMLQASPPGLPLSINIDGIGADFPLRLGAGDAFGFDPSRIALIEPQGIAADLTLPMASGGGALMKLGDHQLGGALQLNLGFVAVQAFALLRSEPGEGLSFVALMSVRFPFPGIQLGFGFSLNGVGGIVGINHRLDATALEAAVLDGSINQLMFPADPGRNALQAVQTLSRVFPVEQNHFIVGPMLELAWGGRIVTLALALVFDLPDPPQFAILGRLTIALPDPLVPAVLVQATFLGQFDPSIPQTRFIGTLCGSHIVGMPLRGDVLMLARGGRDPTLVLSAGGFHPAFVRPPDVPTLRRIGIELSPLPFPRMRAEVYFAFTAGSVQFGAGIQFSATIAGCGIEGWFGIDALCQWSPVFSFTASCGGSVAVEVFGQTLMAISLSLSISGPTPWRVSGSGSVTVIFKDISLDFETSWGDEPASQVAAPDVEGELRNAFREVSAWVADLPAADRGIAILKDARGEEANLLHPLSSVVARQRVLPFDITIARYQGIPITPQRWRLAGGGLLDAPEAVLGDPVTDLFPTAQYLDLTDNEQLGARAFDSMTSGAELILNHVVFGPSQNVGPDFETTLVVEPEGPPLIFARVFGIEMAATTQSLASRDAHAEPLWWTPPVASGLKVEAVQPVALAEASSLTAMALPADQEVRSYSKARELVKQLGTIAGPSAQLVERWEIA